MSVNDENNIHKSTESSTIPCIHSNKYYSSSTEIISDVSSVTKIISSNLELIQDSNSIMNPESIQDSSSIISTSKLKSLSTINTAQEIFESQSSSQNISFNEGLNQRTKRKRKDYKKYVFSFCMFDISDYGIEVYPNNSLLWYIDRFIINIKNIRKYCPEWEIYLYVDDKLNNPIRGYYYRIKELQVDRLIFKNNISKMPFSYTIMRYMPLFDENDDIYALVVRDMDQIMTENDYELILNWAKDENRTEDLIYTWKPWYTNKTDKFIAIGGGFASKVRLCNQDYIDMFKKYHQEILAESNDIANGYEEYFIAKLYKEGLLNYPKNPIVVYHVGNGCWSYLKDERYIPLLMNYD